MQKIPYQTIIKACWQCAELQGLDGLTVENISESSKVDLATLREIFPTQSDILLALLQNIQDQASLPSQGPSQQELLFDLVMARIDVLQTHRSAVKNLYLDLCDPRHVPLLLTMRERYLNHIETILSHANISTDGLMGWGKTQAFGIFCIYLLSVWASDTTADLSKTMAALDQGLSRMEDLNKTLKGFCL